MNGKQTALMAVVGMALLATVMTVSSPAPALALSHLNLDGNFTPNSDIADDRIDSSGTTDNTEEVGAEEEYDADDEDSDAATTDGNDNSNAEEDSSHIAYEELLGCLLNVEAETEQEVQDCIESSYEGMVSSENANDSEDEDEDEEDTEEDQN